MNASTGSKIQAQAKDVTTVGQALAECDAGLMLDCILEMEAGPRYSPDAVTDVMRYAFTRQIADDLDAAVRCGKDAEQRQAQPLPGIIVPMEWYEVDGPRGSIRHRLGAALLEEGLAPSAQQTLTRTGGYAYELAEVYAAERLVPSMGTLQAWAWPGLRASAFWFATEPWSTIVQTPIWLPEGLEPKERYLVLAHVLWMMTQEGLGATAAVDGMRQAEREAACNRQTPAPRRLPSSEAREIPVDQLFEAFTSDLDVCDLSSFEASYVQRLTNIVKLLNYNCWIDVLEACTALDR